MLKIYATFSTQRRKWMRTEWEFIVIACTLHEAAITNQWKKLFLASNANAQIKLFSSKSKSWIYFLCHFTSCHLSNGRIVNDDFQTKNNKKKKSAKDNRYELVQWVCNVRQIQLNVFPLKSTNNWPKVKNISQTVFRVVFRSTKKRQDNCWAVEKAYASANDH